MRGTETAVDGDAQRPASGHVWRRPERVDLGLEAQACFIDHTGLSEPGPAARSVQGTQIDSSLTTLPIASRVTTLWWSVRLRHVAQLARCSRMGRRTSWGPFAELLNSGIRTTSPSVSVS